MLLDGGDLEVGIDPTSVETSSPFSFRYSRVVLRRLEMSFLVGFMARTSTVKPFACQGL